MQKEQPAPGWQLEPDVAVAGGQAKQMTTHLGLDLKMLG